MEILFYSTSLEGIGKGLMRIALSHIPERQIGRCRSLADVEARIRQPLSGMGVAILHAADREELRALIAGRELLDDFRVILALPDNDEVTTGLAHLLKPRFLVFSDEDLPDASVVLGKMLLAKGKGSAAAVADGDRFKATHNDSGTARPTECPGLLHGKGGETGPIIR